jgi:hypothetical protein
VELKSPTIADDYGRILANATIDDVLPVANKPFEKDKTTTAVIEGFAGFEIDVDNYQADDGNWLKFKGIAPPAQAEPPVPPGTKVTDLRTDWTKIINDMNTRTEGWVFKIPDYAVDPLKRRMADLLKGPGSSGGLLSKPSMSRPAQ